MLTQYGQWRAIGQTNARAEKVAFLRQMDPDWLYLAYSPRVRFYVKPPATIVSYGNRLDSNSAKRALNLISSRAISGNSAKDLIHTLLTSYQQNVSDFLIAVLNKDLRCGIGPATINAAWPGLIEEADVMLAELYDPERVSFPCWVSPKLDGNRGVYRGGTFHSRAGRVITGLGHLVSGLRRLTDLDLDGELKDTTTTFQVGGGRIRGTRTRKSNIQFFVFDIINDRPANARYALLDFMTLPPGVFRVPHLLVYSLDQIEKYYQACREKGLEGIIVKDYAHYYVPRRSYSWMKIKPVEALDLEVTGVIEGKGKYTGSLGAVLVEYNGNEVRVTPAVTDQLRQYYWDNPFEILGKTIEVLYQEVTDRGKSLRSPRFSVVRSDK